MDKLISDFLPLALPALTSGAIGCAAAFSLIQSVKMARRECSFRRLPHSVLRLLSFWLSGLFTFLVAYKIFGIVSEIAALHGLIVGVIYPVVMTAFMTWTKQNKPALYDRLRIARRREGDNPDDTGTFFF